MMQNAIRRNALPARRTRWRVVCTILLGLAVPALLAACGGNAPVPPEALAQERTFEARVIAVTNDESVQTPEGIQTRTTAQLEYADEVGMMQRVTLTQEMMNVPNAQTLQPGDQVLIVVGRDPDGNSYTYITEYVRRAPLLWLFGIFVVVTILVARGRGLAALGGMALSFLIIFQFIIPQILAGAEPLTVTLLGAIVIIPITFYLSHGMNRKTTAAIAGTLLALLITGVLAVIFIRAVKLSGYGAEETAFLARDSAGALNIQGVFLASIIIGLLGILDDITVSQAAIVFQLKAASPAISFSELYGRTMDVGKDHIASLVNTLILVYAGSSLPLLLMFGSHAVSLSTAINYELIAEEIVRTLVASIGLILAVPLTTFLTAAWVSGRNKPADGTRLPPPPFPEDWRER